VGRGVQAAVDLPMRRERHGGTPQPVPPPITTQTVAAGRRVDCAVYLAAERGYMEALRALLVAGAELNQAERQRGNGFTALYVAASERQSTRGQAGAGGGREAYAPLAVGRVGHAVHGVLVAFERVQQVAVAGVVHEHARPHAGDQLRAVRAEREVVARRLDAIAVRLRVLCA